MMDITKREFENAIRLREKGWTVKPPTERAVASKRVIRRRKAKRGRPRKIA